MPTEENRDTLYIKGFISNEPGGSVTVMTELLQQVIAQIEKLPADRQDEIAAQFLAQLKDEQKWETSFESTTDEQWDRMAAMVLQEIATGETVPLSTVFPC
jgi:phage I-like protein